MVKPEKKHDYVQVLRRVAEAKKIMEDQMMEELKKRKEEQLHAAKLHEVGEL